MENDKGLINLSKKLKTSLKGSPNSKLLKEYKKTLNNLSNIQ
jgi:hypothetical protein